jgi:hypothetical protein
MCFNYLLGDGAAVPDITAATVFTKMTSVL